MLMEVKDRIKLSSHAGEHLSLSFSHRETAFRCRRGAEYDERVRFSLRTLIAVMLLSGPAVAALWWWPFLRVFVGSAVITLWIAVVTVWLHQWQIDRMKHRSAAGKDSPAAAGLELSAILCFVAASFFVVGVWIEYVVPRLTK